MDQDKNREKDKISPKSKEGTELSEIVEKAKLQKKVLKKMIEQVKEKKSVQHK